jgi:predicted anti-sigma-YlaC factor YlaD
MIADARTVLVQHTADHIGMCTGCRAMWDRIAPYPCTQVSWAHAVVGQVPTAETMAVLGLRMP